MFANLFARVKVDYSEARKAPSGHPGMPGEWALYERRSIFSRKWYEIQSYADIELAKKDAKKRAAETVPIYYK